MNAPRTDVQAAAARMDDFGVSYIDLPRLAQPTPPEEIKTRQGPGGKSLDYVDARYVMETLDRICGAENWQRDHRMTETGKVSCGIAINIAGVGWVWKWDGAGETDIEGEKGSFSDSFKRAAVSWGIARDLYDKDRPRTAPSAPLRTVPRYDDQPIEESRGSYRARVPDDIEDDGKCPKHDRPWRNGRYGGYCTAKDDSGPKGYCTLKAPEGWQPPA